MIQYHHVVLGLVLVILLMFIVAKSDICADNTEGFDSHWNHDMGANKVYNTKWGWESLPTGEVNADTPAFHPMSDTSIDARYTWSDRDVLGLNVYDKQYEMDIHSKYRQSNDYHNDQGVHDTRFSTSLDHDVSGFGGFGFTENRAGGEGQSPLAFMANTDPIATGFMGQTITLSQKTFDESGF